MKQFASTTLLGALTLASTCVMAAPGQAEHAHAGMAADDRGEMSADSMPMRDHQGMKHGVSTGAADNVGPRHDTHIGVPGMVRPAFIPALTDADRAAAFPALQGHTVHDKYYAWQLLFDRFEYQDADAGSALVWDTTAWIGEDIDRLWLRSEGERTNGVTEDAEVQLLWGHAIGPWWDVVGGVRQDFKPGSPQTWAAAGLQGMALYGFEANATAFLGEGGQTALRMEGEYDILFTNRLILQPRAEVNLYGKDDLERGVGSGLSSSEVGLRLRYEIIRQFAPYVGVSWVKQYGDTADLVREEGGDPDEARFVAGVRFWF